MPDIPAVTNIGPHLLGRIPSPPDARDWRAKDLLAIERLQAGEFDPNLTIATLVENGALHDWKSILAFWRWLKSYISHPNPTPPVPPAPPAPPNPAAVIPWADAYILDQGQTGHCVGFGCTGLEDSSPDPHVYDAAWAHSFYYYIKTAIDHVSLSSAAVEDGTYVRSGAKALAAKGLIGSYAFAASVDEIIAWVLSHGPVVLGTDWMNDMFNPDSGGYVRPTGGVAGGHCYLLTGYDPVHRIFTFVNSWGTGWADGGRFYMTEADFRVLFGRTGSEALVTLDLA